MRLRQAAGVGGRLPVSTLRSGCPAAGNLVCTGWGAEPGSVAAVFGELGTSDTASHHPPAVLGDSHVRTLTPGPQARSATKTVLLLFCLLSPNRGLSVLQKTSAGGRLEPNRRLTACQAGIAQDGTHCAGHGHAARVRSSFCLERGQRGEKTGEPQEAQGCVLPCPSIQQGAQGVMGAGPEAGVVGKGHSALISCTRNPPRTLRGSFECLLRVGAWFCRLLKT